MSQVAKLVIEEPAVRWRVELPNGRRAWLGARVYVFDEATQGWVVPADENAVLQGAFVSPVMADLAHARKCNGVKE